MKYEVNKVAALTIELVERTPDADRRKECFDVAEKRSFPCIESGELHQAQQITAAHGVVGATSASLLIFTTL
jgi:hypothetical protein